MSINGLTIRERQHKIGVRSTKEPMKKLSSKEEGAGLIEYALILILVGIIIFVLITLLGPAISKFISDLMASV